MAEGYVEILALRNRPGGLSIAAQPPLGVAAAQQAIQALGLEEHEPTPQADRALIHRSQEQDDPGALLCLRCRISHPIRDRLQALYNSHQEEHGLDLIEMASFVLDDKGELEFPARQGERRGPPFRWSILSSLPEKTLHPFSAEVLRSYNPALCGLPHWARQKVQCNAELKTYLRQQGLLLISDWALLADTSPTRIRQAWDSFGQGTCSADQAVNLHGPYRAHYRSAMDTYRASTGKASGWQPDAAFLRQIAPDLAPTDCFEQLQAMARAVRLVKTGQWQQAAPLGQEIEEGLADPASSIDPEDAATSGELTARIDAALQRAMDAYLPGAVRSEGKDGELLSCLWRGYGEGLTNRPLADRCGCAPGTVSKKLRLEMHTTAVATAAALELRRQPAFAEVGRSVEGAERMLQALRNHLLEPEREAERAPLRRWVHQHLNSR